MAGFLSGLLKRYPKGTMQRGLETGTAQPLFRGLGRKLANIGGPSEEELAEWQEQVTRMQEAGCSWDGAMHDWNCGGKHVEPWGEPPAGKNKPEVETE